MQVDAKRHVGLGFPFRIPSVRKHVFPIILRKHQFWKCENQVVSLNKEKYVSFTYVHLFPYFKLSRTTALKELWQVSFSYTQSYRECELCFTGLSCFEQKLSQYAESSGVTGIPDATKSSKVNTVNCGWLGSMDCT